MRDIFLSYAREDREIAKRLTARLQAEGWTVYWDNQLLAGERFRARLQAEAEQARCVLALWSRASVKSTYVPDEAGIGRDRGTLVPAALEPVELPLGFRGIHTIDLASWDGTTDNAALASLIDSIRVHAGDPRAIEMWPADLVVVAGRPKLYRDLGYTINLTCKFVNKRKQPAEIRWMQASAAGPQGRRYNFTWYLLFDALGTTEHKRRVDEGGRLAIPAGGCVSGVQFRAPALSASIAWPGGSYSFRLLGWSDRERDEQSANLRTEFEVAVSEADAGQIRALLTATDEMWERWNASDDAVGVRVRIGAVRAGLAATGAAAAG